MTEAILTRKLIKTIRHSLPQAIIFKHADYATSGIPDFSVTWNGQTSWWEVKYAHPNFVSKGIQERTMERLSVVGLARYVIFRDWPTSQDTVILAPSNLSIWRHVQPIATGFNYDIISGYLHGLHRRVQLCPVCRAPRPCQCEQLPVSPSNLEIQ